MAIGVPTSAKSAKHPEQPTKIKQVRGHDIGSALFSTWYIPTTVPAVNRRDVPHLVEVDLVLDLLDGKLTIAGGDVPHYLDTSMRSVDTESTPR